MATYIVLISFSDQGARGIKESPDRYAAFTSLAGNMGVTVKAGYYTMGNYDMVTIVEGEEGAAVALLAKVVSLGNIRTQTLRAFSPDEMRKLLAKMP